MITEIGIVAGELWHYLDRNGTATLDQLIKGLKRSDELVLMSLGWLAREGHVHLGNHDTGYKAELTSKT